MTWKALFLNASPLMDSVLHTLMLTTVTPARIKTGYDGSTGCGKPFSIILSDKARKKKSEKRNYIPDSLRKDIGQERERLDIYCM